MASYCTETSSQFVNRLIERVLPWHRLRFIQIEDHAIHLEIGDVVVLASHRPSGWVLVSEQFLSDDTISQAFIERLNAVLQGKTRNDAGELV